MDDEPFIVEALSNSLEERDFRVLRAANGEEGVTKALEHRPDLIISDIIMPVMDGWDLCQTLRSMPSTRATPFIFLTSLDQTPQKILAARLGADDYLTKPFDNEQILRRVLDIMERITRRDSLLSGAPGRLEGSKIESLLVDTVEYLRACARTGVVTVDGALKKGVIYIEDGTLKHAVFDMKTGEAALFSMLRLADSDVAFKESSHPELPSNFGLSWEEIMKSLADRG